MSYPVKDFSRLTLGGMSTSKITSQTPSQPYPSRAQSREVDPQSRSESEHEDSDSENDQDEDEIEDSQTSPVRGQSGFRYDVRGLSPPSSKRVRQGLHMSNLAVSYCVEHNQSASQKYIAFEITERHVVRIGTRNSNYSEPNCAFCDTPGCRHVIWLLDQIAKYTLESYRNPSNPNGDLVMERSGWPGGVPDPYQQISDVGLAQLARRMRWTLQGEPIDSSQSTEADEGLMEIPSAVDNMDERSGRVRDMLAVLSPEPFTKYRPDIFTHVPRTVSLQQALDQGDFEAKVAYLLMAETKIFQAFRQVLRPGLCASDYFIKIRLEARSQFYLLATYSRTGRVEGSPIRYDVPWCARILNRLVAALMQYAEERAPLERKAKEEAVRALVYILQTVVSQNYDVYRENPSVGAGIRNERDRNLYQHLIGSGRDGFILDALSDLADAAVGFADDLEDIQMEAEKNGVPVNYKEKLLRLINHLKSRRSTSGSASSYAVQPLGPPAKREGGDMGGDVGSPRKRRMK